MKFEDFEQTRLAYLEKRKKASTIILSVLIPITIIALITVILKTSNTSVFLKDLSAPRMMPLLLLIAFALFFCVILYFAIITIATNKEMAAYKKAYKTYFVTRSFADIFTNIQYDHLAAMPKEDIRQVMTTGDRYNSNDYMTATYKNINFAQADVHTEDMRTRTDSNGHTETYYVTIFRGRFFIFDFNRNFDFALQVKTKSFPEAIRPEGAKSGLKFHKLETESVDFNHDFKIYGQDGVDTFYILDPAFIEKLHNLYHAVGSELAITFLDGKVYIAVNNHKDAFEAPSPQKTIDEKLEIEKVSKDIKAITDFVDNLDLDHYNSKRKG